MTEHAADLLHLALWILGASGSLIAILLAALVGLAKWHGRQILRRLGSLEDLMVSETRLLREQHHTHEVRLTRVEVTMAHLHADALRRLREDNGDLNGTV